MRSIDREIRISQIKSVLDWRRFGTYLNISFLFLVLIFSIEVTQKEIPRCEAGEVCFKTPNYEPPRFEYRFVFTPANMIWQKISMLAGVIGFQYRDQIKKRMKA